jgi:hypothetical protein
VGLGWYDSTFRGSIASPRGSQGPSWASWVEEGRQDGKEKGRGRRINPQPRPSSLDQLIFFQQSHCHVDFLYILPVCH